MISMSQRRVAAMLALGYTTARVARDCGVSRMTIYRWKECPEFNALAEQFQHLAAETLQAQIEKCVKVYVDGGLKAAQELRRVASKHTSLHVKRCAANNLLQHQQRWINRLGLFGVAAQSETNEQVSASHESESESNAARA